MTIRRVTAAILLAAALAGPGWAQSLADARETLRGALRASNAFASLAGLVSLSDDLELAGARYSLDGGTAKTHLDSLTLPGNARFQLGDGWPDLYLEGVLGYVRADETASDFLQELGPSFATSVSSRTDVYTGLGGVGLGIPLMDGLTLTPVMDLGISRIENETTFGGPGAATTVSLLDGIAFNYDLTTISWGPAVRLDQEWPLDDDVTVELLARYDLRYTEVITDDDAAQDFVTKDQILTLRAGFQGPTGWRFGGGDLRWTTSVTWRHFLEGDLFGSEDLVSVGAGLELDAGDWLPLGERISVSATGILGDSIDGYGFSMSVLF